MRAAAALLAASSLAVVAFGQEHPGAGGPGATLGVVARKAQSRPAKEPWTPVARGDALPEGDGLRTLDRSSVEVLVAGGGRVILSELTTVTLRGARTLLLVAGQVDAEVPAAGAPLEIESGGVRVSVRPEGGPALARLRAREGALQAMVFAGAARVESSRGAPVEVAAGWGITAGAPEPERLLPAPLMSVPGPGAAPDHANPRLWWEDVPGASSYTVEVCHDEACAELEDRGVAVVGAPWAPEGLPLRELYWRVCAVSAAGLDGLPSRPVRFTIRSLWRKPHPRPPS